MARKPVFKLVNSPADLAAPSPSVKLQNRDELVAQYGQQVVGAAEAALGPSSHSDARYLQSFPGDLERARRLGQSLEFICMTLLERVISLPEPDKSQLYSALSSWLPMPSRRRVATRPDKAPKLWADRSEASKINPAQFTRDVYGEWFARGMSRKDLRDLDDKLYHVLSVWEHRHPEDTINELPTLAEVIDRKIASLADEFDPDELRKLGTTLQTRLRRLKK